MDTHVRPIHFLMFLDSFRDYYFVQISGYQNNVRNTDEALQTFNVVNVGYFLRLFQFSLAPAPVDNRCFLAYFVLRKTVGTSMADEH